MAKSEGGRTGSLLKHNYSANGSTYTTVAAKSKDDTCTCPICEENIIEASNKRQSAEEAIFCDGACQEWLHRHCVGLSMSRFTQVFNFSYHFICPRCRLSALEISVTELKMEFKLLKSNRYAVPMIQSSALDVSGTLALPTTEVMHITSVPHQNQELAKSSTPLVKLIEIQHSYLWYRRVSKRNT